ncbi:hypothetical protein TWF694_002754 [Orbilia ellipsospora]|uniref:Uncharacterized protein n=1 Tax=Orbilia ellipsospora TaxID=2528407 RepID=A0AAV9X5F7_9PEZI
MAPQGTTLIGGNGTPTDSFQGQPSPFSSSSDVATPTTVLTLATDVAAPTTVPTPTTDSLPTVPPTSSPTLEAVSPSPETPSPTLTTSAPVPSNQSSPATTASVSSVSGITTSPATSVETTPSTTSIEPLPPTVTPTPSPSSGLSSGAIAGIAIGAIAIVTIVCVVMYIVHRRSRRNGSGGSRFWKYNHGVDSTAVRGEQRDTNEKRGVAPTEAAVLPVVQFDAPLDDFGVNKLFDHLDDSIMDHIVNHHLRSDVRPDNLERYITEGALARQGILYKDKNYLRDDATKVHMFRAIFAYHIYSAIVDYCIFSKKSLQQMGQVPRSSRAQYRVALCREIQNSEENIQQAVETVYERLESHTEIHILNSALISDDLRKGSMTEIAEKVVSITLQLGAQRDGFIFAFRNRDYSKRPEKDPYEIDILGRSDLGPEQVDVVKRGRSGNAVRAVVSPGIYRMQATGKEYIIRKAKVVIG